MTSLDRSNLFGVKTCSHDQIINSEEQLRTGLSTQSYAVMKNYYMDGYLDSLDKPVKALIEPNKPKNYRAGKLHNFTAFTAFHRKIMR